MPQTLNSVPETALNAQGNVVTDITSNEVSLPLISVIMPVYNTGAYLVDAVKSVVAQTYPHLELILVDNASSDELTLKLLAAYAKVDVLTPDNIAQVTADIELPSFAVYGVPPKEIAAVYYALQQRVTMASDTTTQVQIHVVHADTNQGVGEGRNIGMRASTGAYLLHMDADDLLAPQLIEHVYMTKLRTGAELVFFNNHNFSYDPACDTSLYYNQVRVEADKLLTCLDIIKAQKLYVVSYVAWGVLFSRQTICEHSLWFATNVIGEDSDWVVRLILKSNSIYYTPFDGYWRLMHATQMTVVDIRGAKMVDLGYMMQRMAKDIKASPYYALARNSCLARCLAVFDYGVKCIGDANPNKKQISEELFARIAVALKILDVPVNSKPSILYMQWHHLLYKLPWLSADAHMNHFTAARMARLYRRYCK